MVAWTRLIRFRAPNASAILNGEPIIPANAVTTDVGALFLAGGLKARVISGDVFSDDAKIGEEEVEVKELLGPLAEEQVPIIRCVGLNYLKHIKEAGRTPPPFPSIFIKPSTSVADWNVPVPIPKTAQHEVDYEGELTIVIGKTGKNISKENAHEYIAGYASSNDVSCRRWQRDPKFAGGAPQFCYSKGFDKYCPLGPAIVSRPTIGDANKLQLKTWVNGELRQDTNTDDLIFGVEDIVSFCSQGTTLKAGSLIMTGTPGGVGMGFKPEKYLADGDVVEVEVEGLGRVRNTMQWE